MKIDLNKEPFSILINKDIDQYLISLNVIPSINNIGSSIIGRMIYGNPFASITSNVLGTVSIWDIQQDFESFMRSYAKYVKHNPSHIKDELKGIMFIIANMIQKEREKTEPISNITDGPRLIWSIVKNFSIRDGIDELKDEWDEKSRQQAKLLILSALTITLHAKQINTPNTEHSKWIDEATRTLLTLLRREFTLDSLCRYEIKHIMPYYKGNIYNSCECKDILYNTIKQRHNSGSIIQEIINKYGFIVLEDFI